MFSMAAAVSAVRAHAADADIVPHDRLGNTIPLGAWRGAVVGPLHEGLGGTSLAPILYTECTSSAGCIPVSYLL